MKRLIYKVPASFSEAQVERFQDELRSIRGKPGNVVLSNGVDVVEVDDSGESNMKQSKEDSFLDGIGMGVQAFGLGVLLFASLVGIRILIFGFK